MWAWDMVYALYYDTVWYCMWLLYMCLQYWTVDSTEDCLHTCA